MRVCVCLVFYLFLCAALQAPLLAKSGGDELLRHSQQNSYPAPFNPESDWEADRPAISTGYYVVDSHEPADSPLQPDPERLFNSLTDEPETWTRVTSGPNQFPASHWLDNPDGHMYFRNPGDMNDSTDNAFAGPINLGFEFYVNGIRYDSLYISSNGLLAFSNRRYHYAAGQNTRVIPSGQLTAWDAASDDRRPFTDPDANKGLSDPVADNWGYLEVACGGNPSDANAGIRDPRNGALSDAGIAGSKLKAHAPIFAAFWDDWQLSQSKNNRKDDFGQVWIKRHKSGKKLTVYFVNLMPIGFKQHPHDPESTINFGKDIRPEDSPLAFAINAQITLDATDNSFSVVFENATPDNSIANNRLVNSWALVRSNATIGIRGQARYPNAEGEIDRYLQYTEYARNGLVFAQDDFSSDELTPADDLALQFKQHKNVLRVHDVDYLIPSRSSSDFNTLIENEQNYELLAGNLKLGALRPRITIQNVSNDIQSQDGVNFVRQGIVGRVKFKITNQLSGKQVYLHQICIDHAALSNPLISGVQLVNAAGIPQTYTDGGLQPYQFVEVTLPTFATNINDKDHVGLLQASVTVEAEGCGSGNPLYEEAWTYDNARSLRLFAVKQQKSQFNILYFSEDGEGFSLLTDGQRVPDVQRWSSIGAEIVEGEAFTYRPPAPRGNEPEFDGDRKEKDVLSPVIRMNRIVDGIDAAPYGDELISAPIDLHDAESAVLSFSYQRTGIPPSGSYDRGWSDAVLVGPEFRVVERGKEDAVEPLRKADRLEIHFANPSVDGYSGIVNIPEEGWSVHPNLNDPDNPITDNPALTIFGGGGQIVGFDENNVDSSLTRQNGLRHNRYDTGKEQDFSKAFVELPEYLFNRANGGNEYFRFKFKVRAERNSSAPGPVDDFDDFFIDNIQLIGKTETPDLEVSSVRIRTPYTVIPASQAQELPVEVKLSNNSPIPSRSFAMYVRFGEVDAKWDHYLYCRIRTMPFLRAKTETTVQMPNWNARKTRPGDIRMKVSLTIPGGDPNPLNDWVYSDFQLRFGDAFYYTGSVCEEDNDVPSFSGVTGKGLNLGVSNSGEFTDKTAFGAATGDKSGEFAIAFSITQKDTLLGYQAHLGGINQDTLNIRFAVIDSEGDHRSNLKGSELYAQRGRPDLDCKGNEVDADAKFFDAYGTYLLDEGLVLEPGNYVMVLAQLGTEGLELGASAARMGMQTMIYSDDPALGIYGSSILLDDNFRSRNSKTGELMNQNFFWYTQWIDRLFNQFTPNVGNPALGHLNHSGDVNGIPTYSRGSWIPMIRPYFGDKSFANPPQFLDDEQCFFLPVELAEFEGAALPPHGIELEWITASETDNAGFYIERRAVGARAEFANLGFVQGAGNSTVELHYDFLDKDVERGQTYEYRLRQVDFDGTAENSRSLMLTYDFALGLEARNAPNPFKENTRISFSVPQADYVKVEILDLLGKPLRVLHDGMMPARAQTHVDWDARDATGGRVPAGVYHCRVQVGDQIQVLPLNLVP